MQFKSSWYTLNTAADAFETLSLDTPPPQESSATLSSSSCPMFVRKSASLMLNYFSIRKTSRTAGAYPHTLYSADRPSCTDSRSKMCYAWILARAAAEALVDAPSPTTLLVTLRSRKVRRVAKTMTTQLPAPPAERRTPFTVLLSHNGCEKRRRTVGVRYLADLERLANRDDLRKRVNNK
jgi:hypothetical protein